MMRKRSGEITDLWAVPFSKRYVCDNVFPTLTWIVLSVRKFLTKPKTLIIINK